MFNEQTEGRRYAACKHAELMKIVLFKGYHAVRNWLVRHGHIFKDLPKQPLAEVFDRNIARMERSHPPLKELFNNTAFVHDYIHRQTFL